MKQTAHPRNIGRYAIEGILGHGSMGTVYRTRVPETNQIVALKLLNPVEPLLEALGMPMLLEIFNAEVTTMSSLKHPHIADVLDSALDQGRPFYTMEYFCTNLGMMIGERFIVEEPARRVPPEKTIVYGGQLLAGLQCMHAAGVIHRDIKPYNMLVSEQDTIKICDFGMAKRQDEEPFAAQGMHIGSPYYTAPEQRNDPASADGRADLYSAGVLLYRLLTGELPAMKGFMLSRVNPLYDGAWDVFFARALSWRPDLRFQNAEEMSAALLSLELHWERKRALACGRSLAQSDDSDKALPLRSSPLRVSGTRAKEAFAVDRLWQPLSSAENRFAARDEDTVLDETTALIWQRSCSDYPVDRETAGELVTVLNAIRFGGIATWRLPTVNELLSLAKAADSRLLDCKASPFPDQRQWFWSCDRRSLATSWYVNTRLGYTGSQDNSCRYTVRAVSSTKR